MKFKPVIETDQNGRYCLRAYWQKVAGGAWLLYSSTPFYFIADYRSHAKAWKKLEEKREADQRQTILKIAAEKSSGQKGARSARQS